MYAETKEPKLEISCFDIKMYIKGTRKKSVAKMPKDI
jgi:hypothetical protein